MTVDTTGARGGEVLLGVTDGRDGDDDCTYVVAQGFQACVEAFEMQRFQRLAAALRVRLVVVETPGMGFARSRLLPAERRALLRGDYTPLARRMLRAAEAVTHEGRSALSASANGPGPGTASPVTVGVLGYSMGASIATAMAAVADGGAGHRVDTAVLVEPVAVRRWRPAPLIAAVHRENRRVQSCLDETAAVAGAVQPLDRRGDPGPLTFRRRDLLVLANGLRAAGLPHDLATAGRLSRPLRRIVVVRATDSLLCLSGFVDDVVSVAEQVGAEVHTLTVPGSHNFWHSLPAVDAASARLLDVLGQLPCGKR